METAQLVGSFEAKNTTFVMMTTKIFVINLVRADERRRRLEQSVPPSIKDRLEFFRAVDAKDEETLAPWRIMVSSWRTYLSIGRRLSDSEIACFASHYSLWKLIAEERICGREGAVIAEDDIEFLPNIDDALREIPKSGFDYVRLHAGHGFRFSKFRENFSYSSHRVWLTAAYWLSPNGAQRLLKKSKVWHNELDNFIDEFWKHGLPIVAYTPFPCGLNAEVSENSQIFDRDENKPGRLFGEAIFKILHSLRELRRTLAHYKIMIRYPELRRREKRG